MIFAVEFCIVVGVRDADRRSKMNEDWDLLVSFLPNQWKELAGETGALKGLRKDKSADGLLRTLLIHLGCGHSLRETVVRARKANLADLSDVALLKRLRKSKAWLHALCVELIREQGVAASAARGFQVRTFDATTVKESGRTGSLWRLHYSVSLPSLVCDFFKLTATEGPGTSKSFARFRIREGDCILAGRGYSTAVGIQQVAAAGGHVTVRVNRGALPLQTESGRVFDLWSAVSELGSAGAIGVWPTQVAAKRGPPVTGRVCAIRKTEQAIKIALASIGTEAGPKGRQVKPSNPQCARHVIVFTTFPASEFPAVSVLEWYRVRWRVEAVFQRFKALAHLGHLPKYDEDSAQAWFYGKLLVALLVEKLIHHAIAISPWGYDLEAFPAAQHGA